MAPGLLIATACLAAACSRTPAGTELCGAYLMADGVVVIVSPSAEKGTLRLTNAENGMSRRLYPVRGAGGGSREPVADRRYQTGDGWAVKEPAVVAVEFQSAQRNEPRLRWEERSRAPIEGARLALTSEVLEFESHGAKLEGRLYLPQSAGPHPAVVLHQGAERDSWMDSNPFGYLFAARGVAAFCVDKRGVGRSQGRFTMDFRKLADDMAAAVERVKTHKDIDPERIGTGGYSQGGWIAPLVAARRADVRFVVVGYGLADSPFDEDREETLNELRDRGYKEADLAKARRVIGAVQDVIRQDLKGGWREFDAIKEEYRDEPWMKHMGGGSAGDFLKWPDWTLRLLARKYMPPELSWNYDPRPTLERIGVPMLWLIAGEDREAPPEQTIARIEALRKRGKPFDLVVFPGADHGIITFRVEKGTRVVTGYHPDYFRTMSDWVTRVAGPPR